MGRQTGDDFERGRIVGQYQLVTRLSVGGMAELYLAVLPGPGGFQKLVAVKMILPDLARDEDFIRMFLDEARLMAGLSHPHLAQVYELGHEPSGDLYLAMEYIAGQPLSAVLARARAQGAPLPLGFSCRVLRDACLGLHSAHTFVDPSGHARPIVHRDVTPANLMVSYSGAVKVIDFGIARARGRLVRTQVGLVKGTAGYMSPEQAMDEPLDARSDVFSAGMVLYELLAGTPPFRQLAGTRLVEKLALADVPPLASVAPNVPPELHDVVMWALERDVARRCPSARELAHRLEAACPQLFDEEHLAEVMLGLFPDTHALSQRLLESVGDAKPKGPLIEKTVAALQRATREAQALPQETTEAAVEAVRAKGRNAAVVLVGLAVAGLLGGGGWALTRTSEEAPAEDPLLAAREAEVMPQLHMALASSDVTRARQLIEACRVRGQLCPQAQALLPRVEALEAKRAEAQLQQARAEQPPSQAPAPCDLEAANEAIRLVDFDEATSRLRACTTASGLDPRAEKLLSELGQSEMTHQSVSRARRALDEGDLVVAKGQLSVIPSRGVWKAPKAYLEQRLREALASRAAASGRGVVGPKGKVLVVSPQATPAPPPAAPSPGAPTAEERRFTQSADEAVARGNLGEAVETLRACAQALPRSAECEVRLATTLARSGNPGGAYRAYKRFLELARPGDPRVTKVRALVRDYEAGSRQ